MEKELTELEVTLLAELEAAHYIINNALKCMEITQVTRLAHMNKAMEIIEVGVVRYEEREAAIHKALEKTMGKPESRNIRIMPLVRAYSA